MVVWTGRTRRSSPRELGKIRCCGRINSELPERGHNLPVCDRHITLETLTQEIEFPAYGTGNFTEHNRQNRSESSDAGVRHDTRLQHLQLKFLFTRYQLVLCLLDIKNTGPVGGIVAHDGRAFENVVTKAVKRQRSFTNGIDPHSHRAEAAEHSR
jgi:hypothetical protein